MNFVDYLQRDIKNVEDIFTKDHGACLKQYGKGERPHPQDYKHKLDTKNGIDAYGISRYQTSTGALRWAIELGCIYINT